MTEWLHHMRRRKKPSGITIIPYWARHQDIHHEPTRHTRTRRGIVSTGCSHIRRGGLDGHQEYAAGQSPGPGRLHRSFLQSVLANHKNRHHGGDRSASWRRFPEVASTELGVHGAAAQKEDAEQVGDYRPISLVHNFAKLVTKVLASRLAPFLDSMIATNQSAFIKGHRIHDNFLMVQNMARTLHRRHRTSMMLKLDITKSFDTVSWAFLLEILTHRGFGWRWRTLLCNLFNTSSTRVLLNGEPG